MFGEQCRSHYVGVPFGGYKQSGVAERSPSKNCSRSHKPRTSNYLVIATRAFSMDHGHLMRLVVPDLISNSYFPVWPPPTWVSLPRGLQSAWIALSR